MALKNKSRAEKRRMKKTSQEAFGQQRKNRAKTHYFKFGLSKKPAMKPTQDFVKAEAATLP